MSALILVGIFILCLIFSVPIAISLGIASLVFNIFLSPVPVDLTLQAYFSGLDSFSLLAVPFFMLAGDIMLAGGISKRLVNLGTTMMRKVPGSPGTDHSCLLCDFCGNFRFRTGYCCCHWWIDDPLYGEKWI